MEKCGVMYYLCSRSSRFVDEYGVLVSEEVVWSCFAGVLEGAQFCTDGAGVGTE